MLASVCWPLPDWPLPLGLCLLAPGPCLAPALCTQTLPPSCICLLTSTPSATLCLLLLPAGLWYMPDGLCLLGPVHCLPAGLCLLPTAHWLLAFAHWPLPAGLCPLASARWPLPPTLQPLPLGICLLAPMLSVPLPSYLLASAR